LLYAGKYLHNHGVSDDERGLDAVFKALADPTRRLLLDRLRERNGQTLGELCDHLGMARQSATQHLDILVRANLVAVVRRGRERFHYLNPVPIHEIQARWIAGFEQPRLHAISALKRRAEEYAMADSADLERRGDGALPAFVYVTYIRATAEQVWRALTDADLTARYWGHANVSDWRPGSTWEHRVGDASGEVEKVGRVIEAEPPTRLVFTFEVPGEEPPGGPSVVTYLIEPHQEIVRLTVTHENLPNRALLDGISHGWPAVLANLKSLLETGAALPQSPFSLGRMHG
jgi:uncharacterized protein YndB with AHSA1/START domain